MIADRISSQFGIDKELAQQIAEEVLRLPNGNDFEQILDDATQIFGVTEDEILKKTNYKNGRRDVAYARCYIARKLKLLFPVVTIQLVAQFLNKDHTTIIDYYYSKKLHVGIPVLKRIRNVDRVSKKTNKAT